MSQFFNNVLRRRNLRHACYLLKEVGKCWTNTMKPFFTNKRALFSQNSATLS